MCQERQFSPLNSYLLSNILVDIPQDHTCDDNIVYQEKFKYQVSLLLANAIVA